MKKFFLFMMMMTLLPLAGWAQDPVDITVNLVNLQYEYGAALPNEVDVDMFSVQGALPGEVTKQMIADALDFNYLDGDDKNVGNHHYSLTTKADYNAEGSDLEGYAIYLFGGGNDGLLKIVAKPVQAAWFEPDGALTFNYSEQTQAFKLAEGAPEDVTFTVSNNTGTNAGHYGEAIITGTGNYGGEVQVGFDIAQKPIAPTITIGELTFANAVLEPVVTVADGTTAITGEGAFEVAYYSDEACQTAAEVKNAGTYYAKVTLAAEGNYVLDEGENGIQEFSVRKLDIANCTTMPSLLNPMTYTGAQLTKAGLLKLYYPETAVGNDIAQAANYNVSYGENIEVAENGGSVIFTAKENGNLTGTKTVYFNIVAASVEGGELPEGLVFADLYDEAPTYTSEQITPSTEGKVTFGDAVLVEGTDYNVAYGENINAGEGENGGSVIYTFIKNFTGSYTKNFDIAGAPLTIKADNINVNYGTAVPAFSVTYDGFVGGEDEETEGIFGESELTFGVKATNNPEAADVETYATVGTYYIWPAGLAANNYEITFESGTLTVGVAELRIVVDNVEKIYGDADPEFTYKVLDANDQEVEIGEWQTAPVIARAEGQDGQTVDAYAIEVSNEPAHANYGFTYVAGTLTINPRPIAVSVKNQTINYGEDLTQGTGGSIWSFITEGWNGNTEDTKADLNLVLSTPNAIGTYAPGDTYEGVITATIDNDNYVLITEGEGACSWGDLTVNNAEVLLLDDADEDVLQKITAFNGIEVESVKIKLGSRERELPEGTARYWKAGEWNTLTLPFNITVAELSQILGYAIVNYVDPEGYTEKDGAPVYKFRLTMKGAYGEEYLPANKPFTIKTADNLTELFDEDGYIDFGPQEIVAPTDEDLAGVDAGNGSKFVPTYMNRDVDSEDEGNIWFLMGNYTNWAFIKSTSTAEWGIVPFECYIDQTENDADGSNAIFIMEEPEGPTAIRGINVDDVNNGSLLNAKGWYNLNGVKMETAPTMKGVYIKDGKKVVIK